MPYSVLGILCKGSTMMSKEGGYVDWLIDLRMSREQGVKIVEERGQRNLFVHEAV